MRSSFTRVARCVAPVLMLALSAATGLVAASPAAATTNGTYTLTCFTYKGTFQNPTTGYPTTVRVTWPNGSQNCDGISPGRHIFDTSPNHPWYQMPGGGLADGMSGVFADNYNDKEYQVVVAASGHFFCQTWYSGGGGWLGAWLRCDSNGNYTSAAARATVQASTPRGANWTRAAMTAIR